MTKVSPSKEQIAAIIELFSRGNIQEAFENVNFLIKKYPNESLLFNVRGACYASLGDLDASVLDYENSIDISPGYYKAYFNLGGVLQELGKFDDAIHNLERAIMIEPNYAEAHNNLGNIYKDLERCDEAIISYEKAIIIKPDYLEAHYNLANIFQDLNKMDAAIESYKKVLIIKPNFIEVLNNLGVILQNHSHTENAIEYFEEALLIDPDFAEAHNNLGNSFRELGQLDNAFNSYEKAISIKPEFTDANFNLAVIYQEYKEFDKAIRHYLKVIKANADYAPAHNNLGVIYKEIKKISKSVESLEKAIFINPNYAEAHYNLGASLQEFEYFEKALKHYEEAIAINPSYAEAFNNLGIVLKELDRLDDAVKFYKQALAIKPGYAEAYNNLGNVLKSLGRPDEAVQYYKKTLTISPNYSEAHNNLAITFMQLGLLDESVKSYRDALTINPEYAEAHNNLGIVLNMLGLFDEASESYKSALVLNNDYAEAYSNLGNLMVDLKRLDDAVIHYDRAFLLKPDIAFNLGNLIHTRLHLCNWDYYYEDVALINKKIINKKRAIDPFALLALIDNPELHKKAAEIYINDKYPKNYDLPEIDQYPRHKKIRIGYFSADFRAHPVGNLTAELYEIHDRSQFEVYAFSFGPDTNDEVNIRIKAGVDYFNDVSLMSHKEVVMLSRSIELDIAIDLGGFTQDTRTGIFAMQAAPIQINYLGYSSTMGADYMDYIIADRTLIPKNKQKYYSEKIVYLPDSFMVNDTKNKKSIKEFTRKEMGLPSKGFVFCCFNHHYKITPLVFTSWMKILSKVDDSILWLSDGNKTGINNLKKEAEKNGVNKNRLFFAPRLDLREDHLNRIKLADLFLDTLPYNAHATTSDALQVGLPVLTCIGESFASRVAASLINSVDLPELITSTQEQYEELAIELAIDPLKLNAVKEKLNNNLLLSPLYNTPLYTKHLEKTYLEIYERCHKGLEPDHIYC